MYLPRFTRSRYPWIFSLVPHALLQGGNLSRYTGRIERQLPVGKRSCPFSCEGAGVMPANGTLSQSGIFVPLVDMESFLPKENVVWWRGSAPPERGRAPSPHDQTSTGFSFM